MRIPLLSLLFHPHLLFPSLPTSTLGGTNIDPGIQAETNRGIADGSGDTSGAESWASLISPSHIVENIQDTLALPDLDRTAWMGEAQPEAFVIRVNPSVYDFWGIVKRNEQLLHGYVRRLLESMVPGFKSTKFTDIVSSMEHIISATATFQDSVQDILDVRHITFDIFAEEVEGIFMEIYRDMESVPLPDKPPSHTEREEMTDKVLDDTSLALTELSARYGIEEEVTAFLDALANHVHVLVAAVEDINERHSQLLPAIAFSVAVLSAPQSWILRPFLCLFGFGPSGPVEGSPVTWLQTYFWGAAIDADSWFFWLQAGQMDVIPRWNVFVPKGTLLVGGLLAILLSPCFKRG